MATISVKDAAGDTQTVEKPLAPGRAAAASSKPVVLSTEDLAALTALSTALGEVQASPTSNTVLDRLKTIATGITTLAGHVDGLEGLATSLNGYVDGLETLIGTTNSSLSTLGGYVDGLEALATSLNGYVDGLETALSGKATEAKQDSTIAAINGLVGTEYETVAASQSDQTLGATGGSGDLLVSLLVIPASTSPGAVSIKDGSGSAITVFAGGADSVSTLHPFAIPLGIKSSTGAWKVTTGANVSVIAAGNFA